jgi:hypothetical protein
MAFVARRPLGASGRSRSARLGSPWLDFAWRRRKRLFAAMIPDDD